MRQKHLPPFLAIGICTAMILVGCKKLPSELPCGCVPDPPTYEKGNLPQNLAICGELNFWLDSTLGPSADISVYLGPKAYGTYSPLELGTGRVTPFINEGLPQLHIDAIGWHFNINANITDLNGNPLIQVVDNKWLINKNNVGKYNYDANGIEVFDKQDHICFSADLRGNLFIQGAMYEGNGYIFYCQFDPAGNGHILELPYATQADKDFFEQYYQFFKIQQLFKYTGSHWQHARL